MGCPLAMEAGMLAQDGFDDVDRDAERVGQLAADGDAWGAGGGQGGGLGDDRLLLLGGQGGQTSGVASYEHG